MGLPWTQVLSAASRLQDLKPLNTRRLLVMATEAPAKARLGPLESCGREWKKARIWRGHAREAEERVRQADRQCTAWQILTGRIKEEGRQKLEEVKGLRREAEELGR